MHCTYSHSVMYRCWSAYSSVKNNLLYCDEATLLSLTLWSLQYAESRQAFLDDLSQLTDLSDLEAFYWVMRNQGHSDEFIERMREHFLPNRKY